MDGRSDRFPAKEGQMLGLGWDFVSDAIQITFGFKSRRPLHQRDRLSNFRDSGLDFTITDGKEVVSGFPAKKFRRGRACRFPTEKTGRIRRNDWMTRRISNIGNELL